MTQRSNQFSHSEKINFKEFMQFSENDHKTYSCVVNNLIETVANQAEKLGNVVLNDQVSHTSNDTNKSLTWTASNPNNSANLDFTSCSDIRKSPPGLDCQSGRNALRPVVNSISVHNDESLKLPDLKKKVTDCTANYDINQPCSLFNTRFDTLLNELKSINERNPSIMNKIDQLYEAVKKVKDKFDIENNVPIQSEQNRNQVAKNDLNTIQPATSINSVPHNASHQDKNYRNVLEHLNKSYSTLSRFEPWDDLFKTVRNSSSNSNSQEICQAVNTAEIKPFIPSENQSGYQDKNYFRRRNCEVVGNLPTNKSQEDTNKLLSMGNDTGRNITVPDDEIANRRRSSKFPNSKSRTCPSNDCDIEYKPNVKKPYRINCFKKDIKVEPTESKSTNNGQEEGANNDGDDQALVETYLGKNYRPPVIVIQELSPSLLKNVRRMSDLGGKYV